MQHGRIYYNLADIWVLDQSIAALMFYPEREKRNNNNNNKNKLGYTFFIFQLHLVDTYVSSCEVKKKSIIKDDGNHQK
jgi:hypothetical protein